MPPVIRAVSSGVLELWGCGMRGCEAIQQSDQKCCNRCGYVWDMNDPEPPECKTKEEIATEHIAKIRKQLEEPAS